MASLHKNNELERSLKLAKLKKLQQQLWQKDPMTWLKERLGENAEDYIWSLLPEYEGHKWDGSKDPLYNAWMSLAGRRSAAVESATSTGKTFWLARVVLWFLDVFPDSLVVTSAPKQAQLTLNLWAELNKAFYKFKKIRSRANMYSLRLVVQDDEGNTEEFDFENPNLSKSWHAIGFVAGVGSEEQSATKAQGFHREHMLIVLEETPGMPQPVITAFRNTCTAENNLMLAVGNPDSELDPLHIFSQLPDIDAYRISAYDHPNVVTDRVIMPGAVTRASIRKRLKEYGKKSPLYRSRVRGISPGQGVDSLIQLDWLKDAANNPPKYDNGYHAVGVDVANSTDGDKAALAWGQGNILSEIQEFYCRNATHLAYNLIQPDDELERNNYAIYNTSKLDDYGIMDGFIGVDPVGVGAATINAFVDRGFHPVSLQGGAWGEVIPLEDVPNVTGTDSTKKPMYKFQNLRAQMWWEFREDLRQGKVGIALSDKELERKLFKELVIIKYIMRDNMIAVESKDAIRKRMSGNSPNMADAVVYWNWVRKGYRVTNMFMPVIGVVNLFFENLIVCLLHSHFVVNNLLALKKAVFLVREYSL